MVKSKHCKYILEFNQDQFLRDSPVFWQNFINSHNNINDEQNRMLAIYKSFKSFGGTYLSYDKNSELCEITDNIYNTFIECFGFRYEEDATAFILRWS